MALRTSNVKNFLHLAILVFTVSTLFLYYYSIDNPERDLQSGQFGVIRQEVLRTVSSLRSVCTLSHGPFLLPLSSMSYQFLVDVTPACLIESSTRRSIKELEEFSDNQVAVVFETYLLDKALSRSVFKSSVSIDNLVLHSRIQSRSLFYPSSSHQQTSTTTTIFASLTLPTVTNEQDRTILSTIHTALIDNLEHEQYYYTLAILLSKDGIAIVTSSPIVWKHTGALMNKYSPLSIDLPSHIRIGYISDSQSGASIFRSLLASLGKVDPSIDLLIHGGDGMQDSKSIRELSLYSLSPFQLYYSLFYPSRVPSLLFIHGNHDNSLRIQSYHGNQQTYKVLQIYNYLRIIIIDSELSYNAKQEEFLHGICNGKHLDVKDLSLPYFTIVMVHIAPYIEYWDPETWNGETQDKNWNTWVRETALPILLSTHCVTQPDLIISGHSHIYQRGNLHSSPNSRPYYIISGGGGGELETIQVHDWKLFNNHTSFLHHYGTLTVDTSRTIPQLLWEVYDINGKRFDTIKLPSLYSKKV